MNVSNPLFQTGVTFVAASLGAAFGAFWTRRIEQYKHLQTLRSTAYVDFLRGFARVGRAQQDHMKSERAEIEELEGRAMVTDARSRIVVYGSVNVVRSLANFVSLGTQTLSPEGEQAFAELCALMRAEVAKGSPTVKDLGTVLFS